MAILYALVARGTVVLAEFSAASGNASTIARRILEKIPAGGDSRVSYSQDRHIFHIMKADGLTFLCMASDTFGRRIPFAYLEDIHMRFMKNYGKVASTALAYAMNDEFSRVLHQQMEYFSSNPNADTINRVKGEIAEVGLITNPLHCYIQHTVPSYSLICVHDWISFSLQVRVTISFGHIVCLF
ncbi:hypothetical protein M758_4G050700 [Ceratodon purpureus]|nr:hypothetical protein M758_4G050700 [Ceratodon purpureus]